MSVPDYDLKSRTAAHRHAPMTAGARSPLSIFVYAALALATLLIALASGNSVQPAAAVGPATMSGGTWNFVTASTANKVEIRLSGLPLEGVGAADITVAFDSAVLAISSCDTGDLSGACNANAPSGPAQAAGFATPAITTEPVVVASLIVDCVATGAASSTLTITINELVDGTVVGGAQPIPATAENGTVNCLPDGDGDGIPDASDNCPAWPNPGQTLPPWPVPAGDPDCDGFTTTLEIFLGTDPSGQCAANSGANNEPPPDKWPLDFDDSQRVTTADVGNYVPVLNAVKPAPLYSERFDLNMDDKITTADVGFFVTPLNESCSP